MIKLSMPYPIDTKKMLKDAKSLGFDANKFFKHSVLIGAKNVLLLCDGNMLKVKCRDRVIDNNTQFQIIHIDENTKDISDKVESSNIILSTNEFEWGITDNYEIFDTKSECYLQCRPKNKPLGEMDMLWMSMELSYRYGVKFSFFSNNDDDIFYISVDSNSEHKYSIINDIREFKECIEDTYNVNIDITGRNKCKKVKKEEDDFD